MSWRRATEPIEWFGDGVSNARFLSGTGPHQCCRLSDRAAPGLQVITGGSPEQIDYPDPFDPVAFWPDPVARLALSQMANEKQNLLLTRTFLRSATDRLLALVASELSD